MKFYGCHLGPWLIPKPAVFVFLRWRTCVCHGPLQGDRGDEGCDKGHQDQSRELVLRQQGITYDILSDQIIA